MARPSIESVYETSVYGRDLAAMAAFYEDVLGLRRAGGIDEIGVTFRLPDGGVLLVFDPAGAAAPGRLVPPHGAHGSGHVAFSVTPGELDRWRDELRTAGVDIETEVEWGSRGRSLYIRDPAGNSVELVGGDIWPS